MRSAHDTDNSDALLEQVNRALQNTTPLRIQGSNSKAFLGRTAVGELIDTRSHRGIVSYDPTELVVTVRCGTPLAELAQVLDASQQMLPCEPPAFGDGATVGGMIATGLSGPRRPWSGSVRDFVLGTRLITGYGKHLRFGGEVMKNVAGYDLSRLMAGSYGCLGLITEVSLKVLPKPRRSLSISLDMDIDRALLRLAEWGQQPLPISAACHDGERLHLRLEGGEGSVAAAYDRLGGERLDASYWADLNEHRLEFFGQDEPLWRLSLPNNVPKVSLPGRQLIDWGGSQRWLKSDAPDSFIRQVVDELGGHVTCYSHGLAASPFQPLPNALSRFHRNLKQQLDPKGIFNPGRLYEEL